jgi:hypothetical protein
MKILLLMILAHVVDDFVLQPQCLSDLKQKDWWYKKGIWKGIYKTDYLCAGLIHALSWSVMISMPLLFLGDIQGSKGFYFGVWIIINTVIHFIVDNLKANLGVINLWTDQGIHFIQILVLYEIFT